MCCGTYRFFSISADSNNRFRNAVVAAKSRILAPTRTLHFFNAPLNFSPEDMCHVFSDCGVKRPPRIVVFTAKPGQKTSLGELWIKN